MFKRLDLKCVQCGKDFTIFKRTRKEVYHCSPECRFKYYKERRVEYYQKHKKSLIFDKTHAGELDNVNQLRIDAGLKKLTLKEYSHNMRTLISD